MRLPRYFQQEQFTDRPSNAIPRERFTSPLEIMGEGLGNTFERMAEQENRVYMAEESARAQAKVFEIAAGLEEAIDAGDILDDRRVVEEEFRNRVDGAFDEMGLQSNVRRQMQPDLTRLMSINGLKLNRAVKVKRAKIEVDNLNQSLETLVSEAIDAQSPDELEEYLRIIRETVSSVEGHFLDDGQKQKVLSGNLDFIHTSRIYRMLRNPAINPETIEEYLAVHKKEITQETFEKLDGQVDNRIQTVQVDNLYYDLLDDLEVARDDGEIDLDTIRGKIQEHRTTLGRGATNQLLNEAERIELERVQAAKVSQQERADLVVNRIEDALVDGKYEEAAQILNSNRNTFDRNQFEDAQRKIKIAKKSEFESDEYYRKRGNTAYILSDIDQGKYNSLNRDQFKNQVDSWILVDQTIPREAREQIIHAHEAQMIKLLNERIVTYQVTEKIDSGIVLDQKETDLAYSRVHTNDPNNPDYLDKEVTFSSTIAKNVPSVWKEFTLSASRLSPTAENMPTLDQAADFVTRLSKSSPMVAGDLDKNIRLLLPTYWDRAGKTDLPPEKKAEIWSNILKTYNTKNNEIVDRLATGTNWQETVDAHWGNAWKWYNKFAPGQALTQSEIFRDEPDIPGTLRIQWEKYFKDQLAGTTDVNGMPNFDRAVEYAYQQLFQDWGLSEAYGRVRWSYKPVDQFVNKKGLDITDVHKYIDQALKTIGKDVFYEDYTDIGKFALPGQIPFTSIKLEYLGNENKNASGFPDYAILVDGDFLQDETGNLGIKGDDLFIFLKEEKNRREQENLERSKRKREVLNQMSETNKAYNMRSGLKSNG